MRRFNGAFLILLLVAGCASTPPVVVRSNVPSGSEIAVVAFRDCIIAGQEDCDGSGNVAGSIFARVFSSKPNLKAVPLSRPVGPKETLSDGVAAEMARAKGYKFVLNGEVDEYYSVAPMTFRVDRAGVSVRLLSADDGTVVAFFSQRKEARSNLSTPDAVIEKMAEFVLEGLAVN